MKDTHIFEETYSTEIERDDTYERMYEVCKLVQDGSADSYTINKWETDHVFGVSVSYKVV